MMLILYLALILALLQLDFLSCFAGGRYQLEIKIPETYPFNPPKVSNETMMSCRVRTLDDLVKLGLLLGSMWGCIYMICDISVDQQCSVYTRRLRINSVAFTRQKRLDKLYFTTSQRKHFMYYVHFTLSQYYISILDIL